MWASSGHCEIFKLQILPQRSGSMRGGKEISLQATSLAARMCSLDEASNISWSIRAGCLRGASTASPCAQWCEWHKLDCGLKPGVAGLFRDIDEATSFLRLFSAQPRSPTRSSSRSAWRASGEAFLPNFEVPFFLFISSSFRQMI